MKVFHYTKCNRIYSIFEDGFIATEMKRTLNTTSRKTDSVWLTEKNSYPKTALPFFSAFPETSLTVHQQNKNVFVDLDKIGKTIGYFYRFGFDAEKANIKKWFNSPQREIARQNPQWIQMESVANKIGDDVRSFWFSENDLQLENFSLEYFENGIWNCVLSDAALSNLLNEQKQIIDKHKEISYEKCIEFGLPPKQ